METFRIDVAEADLVDLRQRLARTRWPNDATAAPWVQGTPLGLPAGSWSSTGATTTTGGPRRPASTRYEQFVTEVDGQRIHFLHVPSPHPGALPLVLSHGWPGSIVEFLDVLDPLTDPPDAGRRLQPGRAVAARVRLLRADRRPGLDAPPHRRGLRDGHGASRVRALRSAGRRLGIHDLVQHGRPPTRTGSSACTSTSSASRRRKASSPRRTSPPSVSRRPVAATSRSSAPSRRRSATCSTTPRPDWPVGSSRSSGSGAIATAIPSGLLPRTSCSPTSCSTGSPGPRPRRLACTGRCARPAGPALPQAPVTVPTGVANYPGEIGPFGARLGRAPVQHRPLDLPRARRPFRGHGGARPLRRRRAHLLPALR